MRLSLRRRFRPVLTCTLPSSVPGMSVTISVDRRGRVRAVAWGGMGSGTWEDHPAGITVDPDGVEWVHPLNAPGRVRRFDSARRQAVSYDFDRDGWVVP